MSGGDGKRMKKVANQPTKVLKGGKRTVDDDELCAILRVEKSFSIFWKIIKTSPAKPEEKDHTENTCVFIAQKILHFFLCVPFPTDNNFQIFYLYNRDDRDSNSKEFEKDHRIPPQHSFDFFCSLFVKSENKRRLKRWQKNRTIE